MRRTLLLFPLVAVALYLAACSGEGSSPTPTAPTISPPVARLTPANCPTAVATEKLLLQIFLPPNKVKATAFWAVILVQVNTKQMAKAQNTMFQLWQFTLQQFYAGQLNGGMTTDSRNRVLTFGQSLYCTVGLDGSNLALPTDPLGSGTVNQVVFPSNSPQTVVDPTNTEALTIPGGVLTAPTTVQIIPLGTTVPGLTGPLNTPLDQYGPFATISAVPPAFNDRVIVSLCIVGVNGADPPATVRIGHNLDNGGFDVPPIVASVLPCLPPSSSATPQSVLHLARQGAVRRAAREFASLALDFFSPTSAYGGSIGKGAKPGSLSPFGGFDNTIFIDANSATSQNAPAGSAVPAPPSVSVHTLNGTKLGGQAVSFAVTAGPGQLTNSTGTVTGTTVQELTALSGTAQGQATVSSWTIGLGANTVQATLTPSAPTSGDSPDVSGNPVTFSATGGDIIPYLGAGYSFLVGPADHDAGFQALNFNASSWGIGAAAFGSGSVSGTSCPLDNTVVTPWANVPQPTDMLLRHTFSLASWWSSNLQVKVAIDNDIQVFVNGTDVTSTASSGFDPASGFAKHEGCASRDSFTFTVNKSILQTGTNLLAIRARDRGVVAYVDVQLTAAP